MTSSSQIERVNFGQQRIDTEILGDVAIRILGNHLPFDPANIKRAVRAARRQRERERARDRRRLRSLDDETLPPPMSDAKGPYEEIEVKEQCEKVLKELDKYSDRDRHIFLRISGMYGKYKLEEVARPQGLSPQRAHQIVEKMRKELRERLESPLI